MSVPPVRAKESGYRWFVVAGAATMLAIAMGQLVNGLSVFFVPLEREFGWARGSVALINTAGLVGLALGGIVMGAVADRARIRDVCLTGVVAVGVCVALASRAEALWQFYVLFFVAGLLGAGLFAPLIALAGNWFPAGAGLAIGIASAGQAVGQGGVPFGAAFLIEALGWRGAFLAEGMISLLVTVPLALLMREAPRPGVSVAAAGGPSAPLAPATVVVCLSAAVLFCCTCMSVPLMHLVPLIQGLCISGSDAGGVLFAMLIAAVAGRVAFGKLADVIGPMPAYLTASLWQTMAVFAFTRIEGLSGFYVFAPIYGFGYAGVMTGLLVTARALTPPARRASMMGVILSFAWLGHGLGGFQAGYFFDVAGSYVPGFANAAFAGIANLLIVGGLMVAVRRGRFDPAGARIRTRLRSPLTPDDPPTSGAEGGVVVPARSIRS
ncbi:MFS transporter [Roseomonas sp. CCTCC AB2023176]|uniref:MFS transporter n=1 Tax=Roseomonas sp. CCTCC AB2023176 TaxID=3342640 RepID=UPI0035D68556